MAARWHLRGAEKQRGSGSPLRLRRCSLPNPPLPGRLSFSCFLWPRTHQRLYLQPLGQVIHVSFQNFPGAITLRPRTLHCCCVPRIEQKVARARALSLSMSVCLCVCVCVCVWFVCVCVVCACLCCACVSACVYMGACRDARCTCTSLRPYACVHVSVHTMYIHAHMYAHVYTCLHRK